MFTRARVQSEMLCASNKHPGQGTTLHSRPAPLAACSSWQDCCTTGLRLKVTNSLELDEFASLMLSTVYLRCPVLRHCCGVGEMLLLLLASTVLPAAFSPRLRHLGLRGGLGEVPGLASCAHVNDAAAHLPWEDLHVR